VLTKTRNLLRNRLRHSLLGRALLGGSAAPPLHSVRVISATRLSERDFWRRSALGTSLANWRDDARVAFDVAFENRRGLPSVYNEGLQRCGPGQAALLVHDDVWLEDPLWLDKLLAGLARHDVIGVAGNRRRVRRQRTWAFKEGTGERFEFDVPHLSGTVRHGPRPGGEPTVFGPAPAACELLDGVLIAVHPDIARRAGVAFDERFDFHFYDLDFCRTARRQGLSLATWPIDLTHQSGGAFGSPGWQDGLQRYRAKWRV
jgi:hypothetical protein